MYKNTIHDVSPPTLPHLHQICCLNQRCWPPDLFLWSGKDWLWQLHHPDLIHLKQQETTAQKITHGTLHSQKMLNVFHSIYCCISVWCRGQWLCPTWLWGWVKNGHSIFPIRQCSIAGDFFSLVDESKENMNILSSIPSISQWRA